MIYKIIYEIISRNLKVIIDDDLISKEFIYFDNWSSLTQLFIISDIEQEFNIQFDINEIENIKTINDFVIVINRKTNN